MTPARNGAGPRIALLVHGGVEEPGGGVTVPFLVQLVSRLSRTCRVEVFTIPSRSGSKPADCGDARIRFVSKKPLHDPILRYAFLSAELLRAHAHERYDLLHGVWAHPAGLIAASFAPLLGIPGVVSLHGAETANLPDVGYGHLRSGLLRPLTLWCCGRAQGLTLLSSAQRAALAAHGVARDDAVVIPAGVDTALFPLAEPRVPDGTLRALHVANLTPVKDQDTLLRAFRLLSKSVDARLRIVGGDFMLGRVQDLARELGLADSVEFAGHVAHQDMPRHYAWADVLLQSSRHEAGGVAVAEALASGVTVCGTDTGLLHDVDGECAAAVPAGDFEALAMETLRLWSDPDRRAAMRANGRRWAADHSIDAAAEAMLRVYRDALIDSRRGRSLDFTRR